MISFFVFFSANTIAKYAHVFESILSSVQLEDLLEKIFGDQEF